ncbi:coiled-coil domain-containing protein 38 isoform X5 [Odocoileus virginianus]|uniref:Coiled-coil domain-containing protein 38 isoform X5 n=1 Tax=Odocoileus virginianus TaxID=9874 RepID=A0ABM4H3W0_ODOVR
MRQESLSLLHRRENCSSAVGREKGPRHKMSSQFLSLSPVTPAEKEKDETIKKDRPYKIFFKDLFLFKENEMAAKKREKFMNRSMKVYQKSTFSSRMKNRSHLGQIAIFADTGDASVERLGLDPTLILRLTEGADTKRTTHEFINDQRDRFMLEYTLSTKRNTILRFEKHTAMKERQLMKAEKKLEEDAAAFEEFLRENDQRSVDALKIAAQETINKLQMTAELKKASLEIQSVKSEIAKTEFLLREYMKYGFFLLKLSPKQWQIQQAMKRVSRSKENVNVMLPSMTKLSARRREGTTDESRRTSFSEESSLGRGSQAKSRRRITPNLEEKKSSLSKNTNIEFLLEHKELLKANCVREEEKAAELELRSRLFSFGEYNSDAQKQEWGQDSTRRTIYFAQKFIEILLSANAGYTVETQKERFLTIPKHVTYKLEHLYQQLIRRSGQEKLIDSLSKKINQVYRVCIGDAEVGSLNPVQKLVKVESRLVELSDLIDSIPKENVEAIERMKQKERRQRLREEKMREKQKHQEERLKAALERAVAQPKKKKQGRQLIYRSKPPSGNKHELLLVKDTRTKSLEEEYFFT